MPKAVPTNRHEPIPIAFGTGSGCFGRDPKLLNCEIAQPRQINLADTCRQKHLSHRGGLVWAPPRLCQEEPVRPSVSLHTSGRLGLRTSRGGRCPHFGPASPPHFGPAPTPHFGPAPTPHFGPAPAPHFGPASHPLFGPASQNAVYDQTRKILSSGKTAPQQHIKKHFAAGAMRSEPKRNMQKAT